MLSYGKTKNEMQQSAISKTLLMHRLFYLRRPELEFMEEGQPGYVLLSLLLHVKPHWELKGQEQTAVVMLAPGSTKIIQGKKVISKLARIGFLFLSSSWMFHCWGWR